MSNLRITASSTIVAIVVPVMILAVEILVGVADKGRDGQALREKKKRQFQRERHTARNDTALHGSRRPVNSAASKRLTVFTGAERSADRRNPAHVMAHTGRRSYFAAPQRRAGTHVLSPPRLRGGRFSSESANCKTQNGETLRIDDSERGTRAEGQRVDRAESHFETRGLRRIHLVMM